MVIECLTWSGLAEMKGGSYRGKCREDDLTGNMIVTVIKHSVRAID